MDAYERTIYYAKDKPWWGDPTARVMSRMAPDGWELERIGEPEGGEIPYHLRRLRLNTHSIDNWRPVETP